MKNLVLFLVFYLSIVCANAQPITGPSSVCEGSTITLANTSPGGTWTSTIVTIASVGSSTGVVTGVAAGVTTITYSFVGGGFVTRAVTVYPTPVAITGTRTLCVGTTTTLSDATAGGTWSSSSPPCCSVNPLTGVVTGILAPCTATITYTLPTGCYTTTTVTVNPSPAPITGTLSICSGATTTLSSTTGGGTWSSGTTTCATVGIGSGVVTGATGLSAPCVSVITYTLPSGCYSTAVVTVNPVPNVTDPTDQVLCKGAATASVAFTGSVPGTIFSWTNSNPAIGLASAGTGNIPSFVTLNAGIATITVTPVIGGCAGPTQSFTITVHLMPDSFFVTGGGSCCGGPGVPVGLSGSQVGMNYQLYCGTTAVGPVVPGTGGPLSFGLFCSPCVYTVISGNPGTACSRWMTGSATVTVGTPCVIAGPTHVCIGATITLTGCTGCTWSSSNPSIATVGACTGVVTGVSAGVCGLTYTNGGCVSYYTITVDSVCDCNINCNGDFEMPVATSTVTFYNPGGVPCWSTTDSASVGRKIEMWRGVSGFDSYTGNQHIEINAHSQATVYTDFTVTTAGTYYLTFAHRGRYTSLDDMSVWMAAGPTFTTPTVASPHPGATAIGTVYSDNNLAWRQYSITLPGLTPGTYRLFFQSNNTTISGGDHGGNLLDAVSVSRTPPILGPDVVCVGSTIIESNASTCGTWSSSDVTIATISPTGVVTGVSAGNVIITFTDCSGCIVIKRITVVAPCVITGSHTVCVGGTITLSGCTGCTWTSSNTTVATVGSCTGVVTGNSAGVVTITYSNGGCTSTYSVTVNPLPPLCTVTGGGTYCPGPCVDCPHVGLSCSQVGIIYQLMCGTTPVGAPLPGTGGTLDFGEQCTPCIYTVKATDPITGCSRTMTGSATVSTTTACVITGPTSVCVGSTITLAGCSGCGWSSSSTGVATVVPCTGVVTGVNAGVVTITFTSSTGCVSTYNVTVNPLPIACPVTGGGSYCIGQPCPHITLSCCSIPVSYQLYCGSSPVGAPVACTGGPIDFGAQCASCVYTVVGTNMATGCANTMTGSVTVTPVASPAAISGPSTVCMGSSITLTDATLGGTWSTTSPCVTLSPSGSSVTVTAVLAPCVCTINYTVGGCTVSKTVTVGAVCPITGPNKVCVGFTITLAAACTGGTWSSSCPGATVSSAGVVTGVLPGVCTITYTTPAGCVSSYVVTILAQPTVTGPLSFCQNTSVLLTGNPGPGTWTTSGSCALLAYPSPSTTMGVSGMLPCSQAITYTSSATGCSRTVVVTINPAPVINGTTHRVCQGSTITLTRTPAVAGTWSASNGNASVTPGGVVTGLNPGVVNIVYTTSFGCAAAYTVTVNPRPTIGGSTSVCVGATVTECASAGIGGWTMIPGVYATLMPTTPPGCVTLYGNSAGTFTLQYTSSATGCVATKVITVNPLPIVGTITVTPNPMCYGPTGANITRVGGTGSISYTPICSYLSVSGSHISATGFSFFSRICTIMCTATNACGSVSVPVDVRVNPCFAKPGGGKEGEGDEGERDEITKVITGPQLKVYPNPNEGSFMVNLLSATNEATEVRISNIIGQTVTEFKSVTNKVNNVELKTAPGIYLVTVITAHDSYTAKVVVE